MGCVSSCFTPQGNSGNHPDDPHALKHRNSPYERMNQPGPSANQGSASDERSNLPVSSANQRFAPYERRNPRQPSASQRSAPHERTNPIDTSESSDIVVSGNHPDDRNAPFERTNPPGTSANQRSPPDKCRSLHASSANQCLAPYEPTNPRHASASQRSAAGESTSPTDTSESLDIVVSIDFGTRFSGFAYARSSARPLDIIVNFDWPGGESARAIPSCKNQTSLLYLPSSDAEGSFELKEWGWSAFHAYKEIVQDLVKKRLKGGASASCLEEWKLTSPDRRPRGLTVERFVVDYLRSLTDHAVLQLSRALQKKLTKGNIQWCLTVPAIWDEEAKQLMRRYAEKAGMIQGPDCPTGASASPRPLHMILETEAASAFCQNVGRITLTTEERVLLADVRVDTIELVVLQVIGCRAEYGMYTGKNPSTGTSLGCLTHGWNMTEYGMYTGKNPSTEDRHGASSDGCRRTRSFSICEEENPRTLQGSRKRFVIPDDPRIALCVGDE
ncbi:hypothetical protein KP509_1Z147900 [Ceratopteris richardii]|nr:hypothetical protein KP509_1Z147900 [Ceratopteris richardii]